MNRDHYPKCLAYLVSMLAPYFCTIFLKDLGPFASIPIFFSCLMVLLVSSFSLVNKTATNPLKKWSPVLFGLLAIILFFVSFRFQGKISNYLYFKQQKSQLNQFVTEIRAYKKIHQMSDGQRSWITLNAVPIELNRQDTISKQWPGEKYFLDTILNREGIDKKHYESFRQQLIANGFIDFSTLPDGTIFFTTDGMIDNCYGIAYSKTGNRPKYNNCGEVINWQKLSEYWYAWATT